MQKEYSPFKMALGTKSIAWNSLTCNALVLAPLQMVASCITPAQLELSCAHTSHLGFVLTDFLRNVVLPAIEKVQHQEKELQLSASRAIFVVMGQLQWLHLLLEGERIENGSISRISKARGWDVSNCIDFLRRSYSMQLPGSASIDGRNPSSGDYDGLRRELTFRISRYVVGDAPTSDLHIILEEMGPSLRMLRWNRVAWECLRLSAPVHLKQTRWLVHTPFCDSDERVCEYTARELGNVLLTNNAYGLFALFATETDDWGGPTTGVILNLSQQRTFNGELPRPEKVLESNLIRETETADRVVSALFNEIDNLVAYYCDDDSGSPLPSQASCQFGAPSKQVGKEEQRDRRVRRRSAIRVLSSFCTFADGETYVGSKVLDEALSRLVRLASAIGESKISQSPFETFLRRIVIPASSFGQLMHLFRRRHKHIKIPLAYLARNALAPQIVGFVPRCSVDGGIDDISPATREQRYYLLLRTLRAILGASTKTLLVKKVDEAYGFLKNFFPDVIAHVVVCRDYDALRMFAGFFPYFVKAVMAFEEKANRRRQVSGSGRSSLSVLESTLGYSHSKKNSLVGVVDISTSNLEKHARDLMLGPNEIGQMLNRVLMKSDPINLRFLTETVLQGELDLRTVIESAEQSVATHLIKNLGGDPKTIAPAIHAIKTAALALHTNIPFESNNPMHDAGPSTDCEDLLVSQWVTKHFMVAIVMVIQFKWKFKSIDEKLSAMRCLKMLLRFLQPKEAAQYFPQVLASVNAALEDGSYGDSTDEVKMLFCMRMRLLSVQVLAGFCLLLDEDSWSSIGQNLTTITVSLIPSFSEISADLATRSGEVHRLSRLSTKAAVDLLEWLSEGKRGNFLAHYFKDIPFLPASFHLDVVRSNLKTHGVDFDRLVLSNQSASLQESSKDAYSEGGSTSSLDARSVASAQENAQQAALSKRLNTVLLLLENENVSIRKAILTHLLDLLRANRPLFHSLVANEGSASIGQFLTLEYRIKNDPTKTGKRDEPTYDDEKYFLPFTIFHL
jgi:hypothetical protein